MPGSAALTLFNPFVVNRLFISCCYGWAMLNKIINQDFLMEMVYMETADDIKKRHEKEKGEIEERHRMEEDKKKQEIGEEKEKLRTWF